MRKIRLLAKFKNEEYLMKSYFSEEGFHVPIQNMISKDIDYIALPIRVFKHDSSSLDVLLSMKPAHLTEITLSKYFNIPIKNILIIGEMGNLYETPQRSPVGIDDYGKLLPYIEKNSSRFLVYLKDVNIDEFGNPPYIDNDSSRRFLVYVRDINLIRGGGVRL